MTSIRIRPRFKAESDVSPEKIQSEVRDQVNKPTSPCNGVFITDFITLKIKPKDLHFWSPQLTLSFSEEEGKTIIRGLYGPNPTIWTIIALGYGATVFWIVTLVSWQRPLGVMDHRNDGHICHCTLSNLSVWSKIGRGTNFQNSSSARRVTRSKNSYNLTWISC